MTSYALFAKLDNILLYACAMCWNIKAHEGSSHCFAHAELGGKSRRDEAAEPYAGNLSYIVYYPYFEQQRTECSGFSTLSFHDPVNGVHMVFVSIHSETHTPNSNTWRNATIIRIRYLHGYDRRLCPTASLDAAH